MNHTRRDFLRLSATAGSMISLGSTIPGFLNRTAAAAQPSGRPGAKDTILVVVELTGGNDGLNTVIPYSDPEYAKLRTTLRLPTAQLKKINDSIALHPSMGSLAKLLEDHALSVVQGVGYPNPNQSHFRSMDIWQAGSTAATLTEGWIGKALKALPAATSFHIGDTNQTAPLAVAGAPTRVPTLASLEDFQLRTVAASRGDRVEQRTLIEAAARSGSAKPGLLDFVQRTAANTYASSKRLEEVGKGYQPKAPYPPTELGRHLQLAAQLIDADLARESFTSQLGISTLTPTS